MYIETDMKHVTTEELKKLCALWKVTPPSDKQLETEESIPIEILGIYYTKEQKLYEWRITPSSEDKGYSD
jgi:hypothetical protein